MVPSALIRSVLLALVVSLLALPGVAFGQAPTANDDGPGDGVPTPLNEDDCPCILPVLLNDTDQNGVRISSDSRDAAGDPFKVYDLVDAAPVYTALRDDDTQINWAPPRDYCNTQPGGTPSPDTFTYKINGGSQATVRVTMVCVDDPPVAVQDNYPKQGEPRILEDSGSAVYDVLSNDTDVDEEPNEGPKEITSIVAPRFGTASIVQGSPDQIQYTPKPDFCGTDTIRYTLNGSTSLFQTTSLGVSVDCTPDLPVANDDARTVGFNTGTTFLDVLANDTDADNLFNGAASPEDIPIIGVTQPLNGSTSIVQGAQVNTDQIAYTPRTGFCGADSFLYRVFRDEVRQAQVTVTVPCPAPPSVPAPSPAPGVVGPVLKPTPSARAGAPKVAGTAVGVPLTCTAAASCTVSLGLTTTTAGASAAARKKKAVAIGNAKVTLRPGQKRTATVKLNAAGKRALKKSRKLKAKLVVKLGTKTLSTRTVTFKVKRKR